jgi:hypothetical protein
MDARRAIRDAAEEPWVERAARIGVAVRGIVYLVLAYLIARIASGALGGSSTKNAASGPGVANAVAQQPGGRAVVFGLALGLVFYALLSLLDAVLRHNHESSAAKRWGNRGVSAWGCILYGAFAGYAFEVALTGSNSSGSSRNSDRKQTHWSARVLTWPAGWLWLGAVGAAVLVIAVALAVRAVRRSSGKRLERRRMSAREWQIGAVLDMVGELGRAALFAIAGWFVMKAAIDDDPSDSQGVDGSVRRLADQPAGAALLYVITAALVAFSVYLLVFETRYRKV